MHFQLVIMTGERLLFTVQPKGWTVDEACLLCKVIYLL